MLVPSLVASICSKNIPLKISELHMKAMLVGRRLLRRAFIGAAVEFSTRMDACTGHG